MTAAAAVGLLGTAAEAEPEAVAPQVEVEAEPEVAAPLEVAAEAVELFAAGSDRSDHLRTKWK